MASTLLTETTWHLNDALSLIKSLQPLVQPHGYHICLGGSVLNVGKSNKDLDLYFLPLSPTGADAPALLNLLTTTWGPSESLGPSEADRWERYIDSTGRNRIRLLPPPPGDHYADGCYLHKCKFLWSGLRIDVFVLGAAASATPAAATPEPPIDTGDLSPTTTTWANDLLSLDLGSFQLATRQWARSLGSIEASRDQIATVTGPAPPSTPFFPPER